MSRRWFISDLHFGHKNILKYQEDTRQFHNVADMDTYMINTWNKHVAPKDVVYVVGDFAFYRNVENIRDILGKLKGRKILIRGNHDEATTAELIHAGFEDVRDEHVLGLSCGEQVLLKHYPYDKGAAWLLYMKLFGKLAGFRWYYLSYPVNKGHWLIHGHIHAAPKVKGKQINVNVDSWDFKPVSEAEICRIIIAHKQRKIKYKINRFIKKVVGNVYSRYVHKT